jgi:ankyrin repeat protein
MDRAKRCSVFKSFGRGRGQDYFEAVKAGNLAMLKTLLVADKKLVHVKDSVGQSALHWAAKRNDVPIARLLKQVGADVDAVDMTLRTPLFMAARYDMPEMVSLLLDMGANRTLASLNGKTPCSVAKEGGLAWALLNRRTLNLPAALNTRKRSSISKEGDKLD